LLIKLFKDVRELRKKVHVKIDQPAKLSALFGISPHPPQHNVSFLNIE